MNELMPFIVMGILATVGVLIAGLASMAHGGSFDTAHSTRLMYARVAVQGLTLLIVLLAALGILL